MKFKFKITIFIALNIFTKFATFCSENGDRTLEQLKMTAEKRKNTTTIFQILRPLAHKEVNEAIRQKVLKKLTEKVQEFEKEGKLIYLNLKDTSGKKISASAYAKDYPEILELLKKINHKEASHAIKSKRKIEPDKIKETVKRSRTDTINISHKEKNRISANLRTLAKNFARIKLKSERKKELLIAESYLKKGASVVALDTSQNSTITYIIKGKEKNKELADLVKQYRPEDFDEIESSIQTGDIPSNNLSLSSASAESKIVKEVNLESADNESTTIAQNDLVNNSLANEVDAIVDDALLKMDLEKLVSKLPVHVPIDDLDDQVKIIDSRFVAFVQDRAIVIFDFATKEVVNVLKGHLNEINCINILENNNLISYSLGELRIWDIKTGLSQIVRTKNYQSDVIIKQISLNYVEIRGTLEDGDGNFEIIEIG